MIDPLLLSLLLGMEPSKRAQKIHISTMAEQTEKRKSLCDSMDFILDKIIETADEPQKRESAKIMKAMNNTLQGIEDLKFFADLKNGSSVSDRERAEALSFLKAIQEALDGFWARHKRPVGTMWDEWN